MVGEVREYVASCDICQRTNDGSKFVKATAPLHPIKVEPEVWRMVCQEHVDVTLLLLCMVTCITAQYRHVVGYSGLHVICSQSFTWRILVRMD